MLSGLTLLLYCVITAGLYAQSSAEVIKTPDQLDWQAHPFSPYPSTAILFGDPTKPGLYVIRGKIPADY